MDKALEIGKRVNVDAKQLAQLLPLIFDSLSEELKEGEAEGKLAADDSIKDGSQSSGKASSWLSEMI